MRPETCACIANKFKRTFRTQTLLVAALPRMRQKNDFDLRQHFVAAHLRGMRPTPSTKKDTLMLTEKLNL